MFSITVSAFLIDRDYSSRNIQQKKQIEYIKKGCMGFTIPSDPCDNKWDTFISINAGERKQ